MHLKAFISSLKWRYLKGYREETLFDPDFYLSSYPDVRAAGVTPYTHYLTYGIAEGRAPAPYFDTAYYLAQTLDRPSDPTLHYLCEGARRGLRPHPQFDGDWYLKTYADVAGANANPLRHFLRYGRHEGRLPQPEFRNALATHHLVHWKQSQMQHRSMIAFGTVPEMLNGAEFSDDFGFVADFTPQQRNALLHLFDGNGQSRMSRRAVEFDRTAMGGVPSILVRFRSCYRVRSGNALIMAYDEALIFDLIDGRLQLICARSGGVVMIGAME